MDFNDGNTWHVVTDPATYMKTRTLYMHRAVSAKNGVPYVDSTFLDHRASMARLPALVWYQFIYTNAGTPESQADFFLNALGGGLHTNEMVMVDPEVGGGFTGANVQAFVSRWLARVESVLDTRAWVYVPSMLGGAIGTRNVNEPLTSGLPRTFTKDRIVMAPRYSGTVNRGAAPWWPHDVHQYTDKGVFPGANGPGDTSFTTLTADELLRRCNPNGIPVPAPHGGP